MSVQVKGSGTIGGLDEGLVVSGIVTASTQINVGSNIKVGSAGVVTATTFSGSGANLTNLPAANITGTLPAISGANLTNLPAANITGTLPAISGANLTGLVSVANQADNKLITCTGTSNALNAETNLTYNGTKLTLTGNSAAPVVEFINTSGNANEGDVLKLRASGRGAGIDDTDILLITNNTDTRTFGVSNAGTVNTTGNIIMASGKGINFHGYATSGNPSSNLLDDYEEGSWNPEVLNGWGILSPTYSEQDGKYIKIGRLVYVIFRLKLNGGSTNGNRIAIANFPFNAVTIGTSGYAAGGYAALNGYCDTASSNASSVFCMVGRSTTTAELFHRTSNGESSFTGTELSNSGSLNFSGCYMTP